MSVGHVARGFEAAGLPTTAVYVRAFRHVADRMRLARVVVTRHPMGRSLGAPFDAERQLTVVRRALDLLTTATAAGTTVEMEEPFRPGRMSPATEGGRPE